MSVSYWEHQYVYSYSEIHDASKKQKEFYAYLKNSFLGEEFVDIEGNSNYSFILLFDLIKTYENHKNITILEKQFRLLGEFYPKTNSYALHFLAQIMERRVMRKAPRESDSSTVSRIMITGNWAANTKRNYP